MYINYEITLKIIYLKNLHLFYLDQHFISKNIYILKKKKTMMMHTNLTWLQYWKSCQCFPKGQHKVRDTLRRDSACTVFLSGRRKIQQDKLIFNTLERRSIMQLLIIKTWINLETIQCSSLLFTWGNRTGPCITLVFNSWEMCYTLIASKELLSSSLYLLI